MGPLCTLITTFTEHNVEGVAKEGDDFRIAV